MIYTMLQKADNADYTPLYAGQGLRLLKRPQSAKKIMEELVIETRVAINSLANLAIKD